MTKITSLKVGALAFAMLTGICGSVQAQRTLPKQVIKMTPSSVKACPFGIAKRSNANMLTPITPQQKLEQQRKISEALASKTSKTTHTLQRAPRKADAQWNTTLDEDFEYMTDGNDSVPGVQISDDSSWEIPDQYFHTPGWTGEGVYQAGGAVALAYPGYGGVLNTPLNKYKGHLRISFRAKSIAERRQVVSVVLCRGGIENPQMAGDNYEWVNFYTADGWTDYEMETTNYYNQDDCFLQINAGSYDDGIIIDDLQIEEDLNFVGKPQNADVSHFTHEGFTATWDAVDNADQYLLNLYKLQDKTGAQTEQITDFDDLALNSEGRFTNIPDGWTFNLTKDSVATGFDGSNGVAFCGDPDGFDPGYIETEGTGGVITDLSFYVTKLTDNSEMLSGYGYNVSMSLKGYDGEEWNSICALSLGNFTKGEPQRITSELLKENGIDIAGKYTKLRFCGGLNDEGSFVIDQVELSTQIAQDTVLFQKDVTTSTPSYAFTGLDMDQDYYYDVRASRNGLGEGEATDLVHAFGVAAPKATEATDIDERGEFTANWEAEPQANEGYVVCLNKQYTAPEAVNDYEILSEDFSKVTTAATVDEPESYGNKNQITTLDEATLTSGWYGRGNLMANGMLGCRQAEEPIYEIITPELSLGNGDGSFNVTVTAYFVDADTLIVQGRHLAYIPGKAGETVTATVPMTDGYEGLRVWFYTKNYGSFFLDDIKIDQDLKKGDKLVYNNIQQEETTDTKYTFSGLDVTPGTAYSYVVYALRSNYKESVVSDASNEVTVDVLNAIQSIKTTNKGSKRIYDLNGRELPAAKQHGVYIIREDGETRKVVM